MENEKVTLRDYFETIINDFKNEFHKSEETNKIALNLQATETERRLDALNGEAGRINAVLSTTIPREVHERDMKELRSLIDTLTLASRDFVTKDNLSSILKTPTDEIRNLTSSGDILYGKASQQSVDKAESRSQWSMIIAIIAAIIGLLGLMSKFIK